MYTVCIKIKKNKQINKKKLFILVLVIFFCQSMRTLDPIVSLNTGLGNFGAKITNFFSNTKNVIWTGLTTLLVVGGGIGWLYYNYKNEKDDKSRKKKLIKDAEKEASKKDNTMELLKSLTINDGEVFWEESINTNPLTLIKTYLPDITVDVKEGDENSENFNNILSIVYIICNLLDTLIKEYKKNNSRIQAINFSTYYFPLLLIEYLEQEMTRTIKTAAQLQYKDNNLKNLLKFLGEKYCYIFINKEDSNPYTFGSHQFDSNKIVFNSNNKAIVIPFGKELDKKCLFSIVETIKKNKDSDIKTIITDIERKKKEDQYIKINKYNNAYITDLKKQLNEKNIILDKLNLIKNNFYDWKSELPINKIAFDQIEAERVPAGSMRLASTMIL